MKYIKCLILIIAVSVPMGCSRKNRAERQLEAFQQSQEFIKEEASAIRSMEPLSKDVQEIKKRRIDHTENIRDVAGGVQRAIGSSPLPPPAASAPQESKRKWIQKTGRQAAKDAATDRKKGTSVFNPVIPGVAPNESKPGLFEKLQWIIRHWWIFTILLGIAAGVMTFLYFKFPAGFAIAGLIINIILAPIRWVLMGLASLTGSGTREMERLIKERTELAEKNNRLSKTAKGVISGIQKIKAENIISTKAVHQVMDSVLDRDHQKHVRELKDEIKNGG